MLDIHGDKNFEDTCVFHGWSYDRSLGPQWVSLNFLTISVADCTSIVLQSPPPPIFD